MIPISELKDAILDPHEVENDVIRAIAHELLDKRDILMLRNQELRQRNAQFDAVITTLAKQARLIKRYHLQGAWLGAYAFALTLVVIGGFYYGF